MKTPLLKLCLLIALACGALSPAAHAATYYWNAGTTGPWVTAINWGPPGLPGPPGFPVPGPGLASDIADFSGLGYNECDLNGTGPFTIDQIVIGGTFGASYFLIDSSNFGPPAGWTPVTVGTSITKNGGSRAVFHATSITTPLLTVNDGDLVIAYTNDFAATRVEIYGPGILCAGTPSPASGTVSASAAACSAGTGNWNVFAGGLLKINGSIVGNVCLFGTGSSLNPGCSVDTATVGGSVKYAPGTTAEFELSTAGVAGSGVNDLFIVNGDLEINCTVNIAALPGFGPGEYDLWQYTGTLTGTPTLGTAPSIYRYAFKTSVPGKVQLVVTACQSYTGATLTENFDGMGPTGTTTPLNWFVGYAASGSLTTVAVNNGSLAPDQNAGWNFGTTGDSDRALGTMPTASGTPTPPAGSRYLETRLCNDTAQNLATFTVFYDGEGWRTSGATNIVNNLVLRYSTDGVNFVNVGAAFNFTQPTVTPVNSALDGNVATNRRTNRGGTFALPSPWLPGGVLYLRWFDADNSGNDAALAIDNFSFRATPALALTRPPTADVTYDFNNGLVPPGTALFGHAMIGTSGGVGNSGVLKLTDALNSQSGLFLIHDFRAGAPVTGFCAALRARLGQSFPSSGDGWSFNWATDLPSAPIPQAEDGAGTGLSVAFDSLDSSNSGDAPSVDVRWGGVIVATVKVPTLITGTNYVDVFINLDPDGTLDVTYGALTLYNNFPVPGYAPLAGAKFGVAARTGGFAGIHWFDDVCIKTLPPMTAPVIIVPPQSQLVQLGGTVTLNVAVVGPGPFTYQWRFNGTNLAGETNADFTITNFQITNAGDCDVVVCDATDDCDTSDAATLAAAPDTTPPTVVSASADCVGNKVTVVFSEPVDPLTAADAVNYVISDGVNVLNVQSVVLLPGGQSVCLILDPGTPLVACTSYTVTVSDVLDLAANTIAPNPQIIPFACPATVVCSGDKTVECSAAWAFNLPTSSCPNATITALTASTNGTCPVVITQTWSVTFPSGQSNFCSQTVTVVDTTPPVFTNCSSETWTVTGPLNTARWNHTATLLLNGKVLVAGGDHNSGRLSSAELYDPVTGTWAPTGSMGTPRVAHTATLLPNGDVLVVGGADSSSILSSAEVYNPTIGTWTAFASLNTGRHLHSATLLSGGRVLVAGGDDLTSSLSSAEIYYPLTGTWVVTGSLNKARFAHTATLLKNGKVLVAAGLIRTGPSSFTILSSAEVYDSLTGAWGYTGPMITYRYGHTATLLPNGKVLLAGGGGAASTSDLYDLSGAWVATGALVPTPIGHTATLLPDGKVLVAGGLIGSSSLSSAKLYDSAIGTWMPTSPMNSGRQGHTATLLSNGKVLVAGGSSGFSPNAELYNPAITDLGCNPTNIPVCDPAIGATDNCSVPTVTCTTVDTTNGCARTRTLTYSAVDACGNSNTCTQGFIWKVDTTPPAFTNCPPTLDLGCNPASIPDCSSDVGVTDDCSVPTATCAMLDTTNGCVRTRTLTYTAVDACGNSNACAQVITWKEDTTPPVFSNCASNKTVACGDAWSFDEPTASDTCCDTNVTLNFSTVTNGTCERVITRIWLATDCCGNTNTCSQTVTVSPPTTCVAAETWAPRDSNRRWYSVASSADGTKLVAVATFGDQIYTSTDSGLTWTPRETGRDWFAVASSADGTKLVAVELGGRIYTSTDSGFSWTPQDSGRDWFAVASSADGVKLVAVATGDQIYVSTDSGLSWTPQDSSRNWTSVASSADGAKLVAAESSGPIYTSTDSGLSWTPQAISGDWTSVASSADGTKLVAAANGDQIYTSTDSGLTWTARESSRAWYSVASSTDGTKLVAVENGGRIYTSTDSGVSWTPRESARDWRSVASSADGSKLVAVDYNGQIYTSACTEMEIGFMVTCAPDKTVECGASWSFDPPTAESPCCGTNVTITVISNVTSGACPQVFTRTWQVIDCCTNIAICSQTVTVVDTTPPVLTCASNKTVDCCASTVTITLSGPVTIIQDNTGPFPFPPPLPPPWNGVNVGDTWTVTYTFNPLAPDSNPSADFGGYPTAVSTFSATAGPATTTQTVGVGPASALLRVFSNFPPPADQYEGLFNWAQGSTPMLVLFQFDDAAGTVWNTDALPRCVDPADFTVVDCTISTGGPFGIHGPITSVTCVTNPCVPWQFDVPTATDACCTNVTLTELDTVVTGACPRVFTRTWLATDCCGNSNVCSQTVTVLDTTPPTLTCPADFSVACTNEAGATVAYTVTATDECDTNVTVVCAPASGSLFPQGVTTVDCTATDACGNSNTCAFTVMVKCCARLTAEAVACDTNGSGNFTYTFTLQNLSGTDASWVFLVPLDPLTLQPDPTCVSVSPGFYFLNPPLASGASQTFSVTLKPLANCGSNVCLLFTMHGEDFEECCSFTHCLTLDAEPPQVTCAPDKGIECPAPFTFDPPTAWDACCGTNVTIAVVGDFGPPGTPCSSSASRIWRITDCAFNSVLCTQTVTRVDTTAPVVTCAPDKIVECPAPATFDPPTAVDACWGNNVTITVLSNAVPPPLGTLCSSPSIRVWQITDPCGNSVTCTQTVTVVDTTPPLVTCPADKTVVWSIASTARFSLPSGVAVDSAGNVYVADTVNHTIRKMTPAGVVTTLAGQAGSAGYADATGGAARFDSPGGVAIDSAGNVYVADSGNSTIRKVTLAGVVTTLAGQAGSPGNADGPGSAARFNGPTGVGVDSVGNVYVADSGNHTIRIVTSAGVVTTLAGQAVNPGSANGTGSAAQFNLPVAVAVDSVGNVYVADTRNSTIRKVTPAGAVTTLAGQAGSLGYVDGVGTVARFALPVGVAVDSAGNVYVADAWSNSIRKVTPTGLVATLAGQGTSGSADGTGSAARFGSPFGVTVNSAGNVYVADTYNHTIRKVTPAGVVTTLAGLAGSPGSADTTWNAWSFDQPAAFDACCPNVTLQLVSSNATFVSPCRTVWEGVWEARDCCNNVSTCTQTVTVADTTPPIVNCAPDRTIECGTPINFDPPTATDAYCGSDVTIIVLSDTVPRGFNCANVFTRVWQITDCCGNSTTCAQTITAVDTTPPDMTFPRNKTVVFGSAWNFDPPTASDACCPTSPTISVLSTVTNGGCSQYITRTWLATDCCGNTDTRGQMVTIKGCVPGETWIPRYYGRWSSVASSSDGTKLVAGFQGFKIYTSTDSGVTWVPHDSNRDWTSVASSADGSKLAAVAKPYIYTSSDSGVTWAQQGSFGNWWSVASSADGSKLVTVENGYRISTSTDSGATWTPRDSTRLWSCVASSADGSKLVAAGWGTRIYTSTDSGMTWTPRDSIRTWWSVASSADGSKLVAGTSGQIYTSTDSGLTWVPRDSNRVWSSVASSANGIKLLAGDSGGRIYTSTDSGVTWTPHESNRSWSAVASSADGTKLVATDYEGAIYTSACPEGSLMTGCGPDRINVTRVGANLVFSWAATDGMNITVEESTNLTNWAPATNVEITNGTNGEIILTVPIDNTNGTNGTNLTNGKLFRVRTDFAPGTN